MPGCVCRALQSNDAVSSPLVSGLWSPPHYATGMVVKSPTEYGILGHVLWHSTPGKRPSIFSLNKAEKRCDSLPVDRQTRY